MARNEPISVEYAVYKLQHCLLNGIRDESKLFAAGSVMSQSDYKYVVIERSLADMCGYPLCGNILPYEHSLTPKPNYHIDLSEHEVYDIRDKYLYCSTKCFVDSQAFAGSLEEESFEEYLGWDEDLELSKLKIQEYFGSVSSQVSMEEWAGPSNAIEGYVPQRDRSFKSLHSKNCKQDEYTVSKIPTEKTKAVSNTKSKPPKKQVNPKEATTQTCFEAKLHELNKGESKASGIALSQAAEAVASGESDVPDAVTEAGITVLAPPNDLDEACSMNFFDAVDPEPAPLKWPKKKGISESDFFDSEDSLFDSPPEGFSLTVSSFATMYMALFSWTSSSTLAFVYGCDDSFHEDYASVNEREYPRKTVLTDGRSSEIKKTLAGCLARALPGLVADLRLSTPVSIIENGLGSLLDTMSFLDPLPPFRMKQWQAIVLLLIEALSVSRIPALTPHMTSRRTMFQKVFDGAQISAEEYEVMKDLVIPLGRVPQLSTQSGG